MVDILSTEQLTKQFNGLTAVDQVSVSFSDDKLHAIIGPNGAGKTTFFNLLSGTLSPTSGKIHFDGSDITDLSPKEIAEHGLIRSFQITNVYSGLTVLENVCIAAQRQVGTDSYKFWRDIDELEGVTERADAALEQVSLVDKRAEPAENLSHGEQRMLELAIVLATDPAIMLLDEPTSGMSAEDTGVMTDLINGIAEDIPVLLIEHKMEVVLDIADLILVLHQGRIIAKGSPEEIQENREVREVYLGGSA